MEIVDLIDTAVEDSARWFPAMKHNAFFTAACMAGEAGEVINWLKKVERGSHDWTPEMQADVGEEIADVFTYMLLLCGQLGVDLEAKYHEKRKANEIRYSGRKALTGEDTQVIPPPHEYFKARGG